MSDLNNSSNPCTSRKRVIDLNDEKKPDLNKFKERFRVLHQRRVLF